MNTPNFANSIDRSHSSELIRGAFSPHTPPSGWLTLLSVNLVGFALAFIWDRYLPMVYFITEYRIILFVMFILSAVAVAGLIYCYSLRNRMKKMFRILESEDFAILSVDYKKNAISSVTVASGFEPITVNLLNYRKETITKPKLQVTLWDKQAKALISMCDA